MVWEQHSLVIVMTTRAMERGRPKCHQYWETDVDAEATYGYFVIKTMSIETNDDYTVSTLQITNKKVNLLIGRIFFVFLILFILISTDTCNLPYLLYYLFLVALFCSK